MVDCVGGVAGWGGGPSVLPPLGGYGVVRGGRVREETAKGGLGVGRGESEAFGGEGGGGGGDLAEGAVGEEARVGVLAGSADGA